jgi:hypothetical protein
MIRTARQLNRRAKAALALHEPSDVLLNQPGRALARCILWWTTAIAFATLPLGILTLQLARIDALNYVFANLSGLFLSGILWQLLIVIVAAVYLVSFPVLGSSRVPRRPVTRPHR